MTLNVHTLISIFIVCVIYTQRISNLKAYSPIIYKWATKISFPETDLSVEICMTITETDYKVNISIFGEDCGSV